MLILGRLAAAGAALCAASLMPGTASAAPLDTARAVASSTAIPFAYAQADVRPEFRGGGGGFRGGGGGGFRGGGGGFRGGGGPGFRGGYRGGGGYGYGRGGYGRGFYGRGRGYGYGRRWGYGPGIGLGLGLATGAIVGGALAAQAAPPVTYVEPGVTGTADEVAYCSQRYKSYDPASGTYLGYDGIRHPCPS